MTHGSLGITGLGGRAVKPGAVDVYTALIGLFWQTMNLHLKCFTLYSPGCGEEYRVKKV